MDNETLNIKKENYLPSFLIKDIEFDEFDKEIQSKENEANSLINQKKYAIKKYNFNILVIQTIQ